MPHFFAFTPSWKLSRAGETGWCSAWLCPGALLPEPTVGASCSPQCISLAAPATSRDPFIIPHLKCIFHLKLSLHRVEGTWLSLNCKGQSSFTCLGLGYLSVRSVVISFTVLCNKQLWEQLDFAAYLLSASELPSTIMCFCTGLCPRPHWHQLHNATCVQTLRDRSSVAGTR